MSLSTIKKNIVLLNIIFIALISFNVSAKVSGLPDFTHLVEEYGNAVVNISTTQKIKKRTGKQHQIPGLPQDGQIGDLLRRFFEKQNYKKNDFSLNDKYSYIRTAQKNNSLGSGFIIDSDGYVVTNHHVIKDADEITVRLKDRRELKATVVGSDARSDIALLKVKADHLPVVNLGSSENLKVGSWVMAIGSPFGFDHSVSVGVVSATGRTLPNESYVPFIQTDVAINPGNSGGPLFNLDGEVIGINSQIYSGTGGYMGVSFAIPVDVAKDIVEQLKASGHARWGWLGVLIQDVNKELAESFGMEKPMGAVVLRVMDDTPAKKAGVEVGDVITHFNGKVINRSSDLPLAVGRAPIGKNVKVQIVREGKQKFLNVKVAELPSEDKLAQNNSRPKEAKSNRLNIEVIGLTKEQRERAGVENGLLVQAVEEGAAASAGIRRGDILLKINRHKIENIKQFLKIIKKMPSDKVSRILIQRGEGRQFLVLKIND